jgi:integrase/recombinase XerC
MDKSESLTKFEQYLLRRFPDRRTAKDYLSDIRQFGAVCPKDWRDVSMHDIDTFVDQQRTRGLKTTSIHRRVAALKTFFDFLAEETGDLSWSNPVHFKRHAGKRPRCLPRDLSDADLQQVWAGIRSARDRAWFVLMVRGGLRVGEVVGLKLEDLLSSPMADHPARLRVLGKGSKERVVLLAADAYVLLQTWLAERPSTSQPFVFLNERGQPLSANGVEWLLHRYGRQAGIDLTPHQLRHTYARQLTEAGMPITSLGKLLGHAQITTTQIYTSRADPDLSQAYQTAMHHLETPPNPPFPPPLSPPAMAEQVPPPREPSLSGASHPPPEPKQPDWQAWAPQLPEPIRQASLDYVQQHWYIWPAKRRRVRALNLLNELERLWGWFLERRPLTQPGEVSLNDLRTYQTDQQARKYAPGTINRRMDFLLGILRQQAEQAQPVDQSVFRLRYLRRPQSLPKHLTEAESQRLEAFLQPRLPTSDPLQRLENACGYVLLHSGLRASECTELLLQDLHLASQSLIVRQGKGQRDRLVYLSAVACQAIQVYLQGASRQGGEPVWLQPNGKPISAEWLRKHVAQVGQAVGIQPLNPLRLRHTCATRLLNAGMDITRIQKFLGHEQVTTTMIYARIHDATVEQDYRQALRRIEQQAIPLLDQPIPVGDWPTRIINVQNNLDDSV